jgi:CubicO group peptidase (beta-lactamase class C family)
VSVAVAGRCDPRLRGVREAFAENFTAHGEVGAAVAVTIDNQPVVDLWAGHADAAQTHPWTRDTIVNIASATKGLTAICAHRLVDRGLLDLEAPVATYWPEFAQAGKADLPVHLLLSHRAGLPAIETPLPTVALYDWGTMTAALAAQAPWWEPGTRHGYHVFTFGWLVGEVVRRITGQSLSGYWREEVAAPLGLDCHMGLPATQDARVAEFLPVPPPPPGELGFEEALLLAEPDGVLQVEPADIGPPGQIEITAARAGPPQPQHLRRTCLGRDAFDLDAQDGPAHDRPWPTGAVAGVALLLGCSPVHALTVTVPYWSS